MGMSQPLEKPSLPFFSFFRSCSHLRCSRSDVSFAPGVHEPQGSHTGKNALVDLSMAFPTSPARRRAIRSLFGLVLWHSCGRPTAVELWTPLLGICGTWCYGGGAEGGSSFAGGRQQGAGRGRGNRPIRGGPACGDRSITIC